MDSRIYRRTQTFCLALVSIGLVGVAPLVAQTTTDTFVVGGALVPNPGVPSGSLTGTVTATCSPNILTDSFGNQFTNCAITSMSIQDSNTGVTVTSPGNSILVHYVSTSAPSSGQWGITPNLIFGPDVLSNVWNSGSVQGWTYLSGGYGGTFTILPLSIVDNPEDRGASCSDSSPPPGQTHCGDPISIGTGNLFEAVIDYETAGSNKLSFTRYYNSNASNAHAVALGRNWRSNYDRFVVLSSPSSVLVEGQNGQQITFTLNAGRWSASSDRDLKLINVGTLWTLTDAYDNVETYAMAAGNIAYLTSIQARNGYTQTLQYNSSNQLTAVTDSYNRSFQFSYLGPVVGLIVTPDGIPIQYSYHFDFTAGQFDRLVGVRYFGLNTSTSEAYLYQNATFPFALTGIIDGNGTTYTTWTYDVFGRALSSQHGAGADLTTIRYNDIDRSRTVTNALGQQEVYRFTTLQGVPKLTEIDRIATATTAAAKRLFTYDANGYPAGATDWNGNRTTYTNNSHGLPTVINEAVGTSAARTTTITYHATLVHLPASIATAGLTTTFTYDSSGNPLTKTLMDTTATIVPYSTNGQRRIWTYTWSNALLASITSPNSPWQKWCFCK